MRDARLGISTAALHHNLRRVREAAPYSRVMAMVKADAYGHGARLVADKRDWPAVAGFPDRPGSFATMDRS